MKSQGQINDLLFEALEIAVKNKSQGKNALLVTALPSLLIRWNPAMKGDVKSLLKGKSNQDVKPTGQVITYTEDDFKKKASTELKRDVVGKSEKETTDKKEGRSQKSKAAKFNSGVIDPNADKQAGREKSTPVTVPDVKVLEKFMAMDADAFYKHFNENVDAIRSFATEFLGLKIRSNASYAKVYEQIKEKLDEVAVPQS